MSQQGPRRGLPAPNFDEFEDDLDELEPDTMVLPRRSLEMWQLHAPADDSFVARRGSGPAREPEGPVQPARSARLVDSVPPPRPVLPRGESTPLQPSAGRRFADDELPADFVPRTARRSASSPSQWSPISPSEPLPQLSLPNIVTPIRPERQVITVDALRSATARSAASASTALTPASARSATPKASATTAPATTDAEPESALAAFDRSSDLDISEHRSPARSIFLLIISVLVIAVIAALLWWFLSRPLVH